MIFVLSGEAVLYCFEADEVVRLCSLRKEKVRVKVMMIGCRDYIS